VLGQRNPLGKMFFEHEAELSLLSKLRDLSRQVSSERLVIDPRQKRVELVSHVWPDESAGRDLSFASRLSTIRAVRWLDREPKKVDRQVRACESPLDADLLASAPNHD